MITAPPSPGEVRIIPVPGIGEIRSGDDLAEVIGVALLAGEAGVCEGDILCVTSKILSKAHGLRAAGTDRRAVVADQSVRVIAERSTRTGPTRIVEGRHGVVMAAAGVDSSNTGAHEAMLLLPDDPDRAAADLLRDLTAYLRSRVGRTIDIGLVLTDTAGRPWRSGQIDFALGAAGVHVLHDYRGGVDADGRPLEVTVIAVADELAAAADLVKGKVSRRPVAIIRGLAHLVAPSGLASAPAGARQLLRTGRGDFFAMGHLEATRAALGAPPGSPTAARVGIPGVTLEPVAERLQRALRLALGADPHRGPAVHSSVRAISQAPQQLVVTLAGADDFALGRAFSRLEVALWSESLVAHRVEGGERGLLISAG